MTKLLYLDDMQCLHHPATVVDVQEEDGRMMLVLDQTIFYPQGGGQPYDIGVITSPNGMFRVEEVRFVDGVVRHIGQYSQGIFSAGESVDCVVDVDRRLLNSKLHSAGHLIDMALDRCGIDWVSGKGFHFPDGAYVEYAGSLDGLDREALKEKVIAACADLVSENLPITFRYIPKEEMASVCKHVPEYLPEGKPGRVVFIGEYGIPCGGTHVASTAALGAVSVRNIKQKGETVKIGYDVAR